jgi:hypothetical protein
MASRKTYECFVCKRQGFDNVQVYLDGKDAEGKTKYLNEDMTVHTHQDSSATTQATQPQPQAHAAASTTIVTQTTKEDRMIAMLNGITIKIDRLSAILEQEKDKDKVKKEE